MVGLRKATAYSKKKVVPYTRISKKAKNSFIKAVPPQKIVKFTMGKEPLHKNGKLPHCLTIVTAENIQVRHNSFEACRQFINKKLDKELAGQYYFKIIPYTHHVQRENRMLTGAGADRMQTGMQLAFGKAMGKSAIMKKNGRLFFIALPNEKALRFTRVVLKQVKSKLPCKIKVFYEDISKK